MGVNCIWLKYIFELDCFNQKYVYNITINLDYFIVLWLMYSLYMGMLLNVGQTYAGM